MTRFALAPERLFVSDDQDDLDFSIIALGSKMEGSKELSAFGALPLSAAGNKHALGDLVNIIQHPDGRMKEAVVRENQLVSRPKSGAVLHYVADTEPGSSGSPVFNVLWSVVALHHWGGPHRDLVDERGARVHRTVNEGVRISAIVADLTARKSALKASEQALIEEALSLGAMAPELTAVRNFDLPYHASRSVGPSPATQVDADGTVTWSIPLSVSVRFGAEQSLGAPVGVDSGKASAPAPAKADPEAKLELDENYENRGGYDPAFLGGTRVALPTLSAAQKRVAARNKEARGANPYELQYEHFSAVINGARRLAFLTATNIDGAKAKDLNRTTGVITDLIDDDDGGAEAAEEWFSDRRIEDRQQTPPDFYLGQTAFDANGRPIKNRQTSDHRNRMFQQGHLTRPQDPLWGSDEDVICAHADTFHVTNRAPQVGYFNMGIRNRGAEAAKRWRVRK